MEHIKGKNKDGFVSGNEIKFIFSDRLSVFDDVVGEVKNRGLLLAKCTRIIFSYLENKGIPTAMIGGEDNFIVMENCISIPFEFIMRNLLTGSAFTRAKDVRLKLPEGMLLEEYARFPETVIEVSTKRELRDRYDLSEEEITTIMINYLHDIDNKAAVNIFNRSMELVKQTAGLLSALFDKAGLVLVDGKVELGLDGGNHICLIDSFGPDEFRTFDKEWFDGDRLSPPVFYDKQFIRDKLKVVGKEEYFGVIKKNGNELISKYESVTARLMKASVELCQI